jgi:HEAT repeat protein
VTTNAARLRTALQSESSSDRLQAALAAGTHPDPAYVGVLVERCAIEPDFYVRDMLTWALTRHPKTHTVPALLEATTDARPQARSQALHSLSKVGDPLGWEPAARLLRDPDDDVARSAWRAAVFLVPAGAEAELAKALASQLGRGARDTRLSLSRALSALGGAAEDALAEAARSADPTVRVHALATERLLRDPDEAFDASMFEARRFDALSKAPRVPGDEPL